MIHIIKIVLWNIAFRISVFGFGILIAVLGLFAPERTWKAMENFFQGY